MKTRDFFAEKEKHILSLCLVLLSQERRQEGTYIYTQLDIGNNRI